VIRAQVIGVEDYIESSIQSHQIIAFFSIMRETDDISGLPSEFSVNDIDA